MYSIAFPNMFSSTSTNLIYDHDATFSNLKLALLSDKKGLFGDPFYGSNLKKLFFEQNSGILRDIVIDDIYTTILTFVPQIQIDRKDITITSDKTDIFVNIKCKNLIDYTTDTFNINLTDGDING